MLVSGAIPAGIGNLQMKVVMSLGQFFLIESTTYDRTIVHTEQYELIVNGSAIVCHSAQIVGQSEYELFFSHPLGWLDRSNDRMYRVY